MLVAYGSFGSQRSNKTFQQNIQYLLGVVHILDVNSRLEANLLRVKPTAFAGNRKMLNINTNY